MHVIARFLVVFLHCISKIDLIVRFESMKLWNTKNTFSIACVKRAVAVMN